MLPHAHFCLFSFLGDILSIFFFLLSVFNIREDQNDALRFISTSLHQCMPVLSLRQKETIEPNKKILLEEKKNRKKDRRSFVISGSHWVVLLTQKARWVVGVGYEALCNTLFFSSFFIIIITYIYSYFNLTFL